MLPVENFGQFCEVQCALGVKDVFIGSVIEQFAREENAFSVALAFD